MNHQDKKDGQFFFHGGWCWMRHPSRNIGNAIPVFMYEAEGVRYYVPLDPSEGGELVWDERDDEWEMIVPPMASSLIDAAPLLYEALERYMRACPADEDTTKEFQAATNFARCALSHARGEAKGDGDE